MEWWCGWGDAYVELKRQNDILRARDFVHYIVDLPPELHVQSPVTAKERNK